MNAIETHALTRRFGAHTAVDGLDLTVRQGELFALLGVNGAGKTTTLRMLSGLLQPTGGEADILGFRLTQQPQEIKRRINLSPQETAVAPNLTVRENLELCRLQDRAHVVSGDAMNYLKSGERFDLIFLDPPYASGLLQQALEQIAKFDICREHGIIVAESAADQALPVLPAPYCLYREYRYGKIKLTVYHRKGNEE